MRRSNAEIHALFEIQHKYAVVRKKKSNLLQHLQGIFIYSRYDAILKKTLHLFIVDQ